MAGRHRSDDLLYAVSKVPEVTAYFWGVKVLTTALGESTSDYLVHVISPYLAVGAGFVAFAIAIIAQFSVRQYVTWVYWVAVAMVAVFGTMVADAMHVALHVQYKVSAAAFAVLVAVVLCLWYASERTLSIHSITTPRREFFYWATVILTFALGTATGDLFASTFHLGYLASALIFTALIAVPAAGYRMGLSGVAAFWTAYILTRPIGASFADYLGKPHSSGGLGIGSGPICLVTAALFVCVIAYLAATRKDMPGTPAAARQRALV
ncbi:MAG: hypothetical protein JOY82_03620 [Streptosporangiaceae bacterium]|nr:hypothetical protein [Streptosporangiaceae bacterium]MBV9853602.1 hypothetical protein [Streptosporangiaceae bacterium]